MTESKLSERIARLDEQWLVAETPGEFENILLHAGRELINNSGPIIAALLSAESPPTGTEPQGCPTPGACSCGGGSDAVAKAVEAEQFDDAAVEAAEKAMIESSRAMRPKSLVSRLAESIAADGIRAYHAAIRARTTSPSPPVLTPSRIRELAKDPEVAASVKRLDRLGR